MANRLPEEGRSFDDPNSLEAQVREYVNVKKTIDNMETRSKELRDKLFGHLDTEGFEDDKGNFQLVFSSAIEGVTRLEKQRRVSRKLNEPLAMSILDEKGLGDEIYETKLVINEDALMAAYYEGKLTEDELDSMFPASVTWALRTMKS